MHREPRQFGQAQSRWTLAALQRVCHWLADYTPSGIWRVLDRLDLHWKRGRDAIHSPDPDYDAKRAYLADRAAEVQAASPRLVLLYGDELTYYRQPTLASAYGAAGPTQPLARRSYRSNTATRVVGALNALTGQVSVLQASRIGVRALITFYEQLCREYAAAERLDLVLDNWPIHFLPDVLAALEPQDWPWPWVRSPGVKDEPS
ncbi:MAG TPA: transposase, partial [Vicinamibacteria bacterium]|nr:transposase [Vicinamibacteria bacterium]